MSTLLAPPDLALARPWVPGPTKPLAGGACPGCGGLDDLRYSLEHQYVACTACGWQRRLTTRADRINAALAATGMSEAAGMLLDALARRDPDALPPAAALLWRPVAIDVWSGPSRSVPATTYTLEIHGSRLICGCPNKRGLCWHIPLVRRLAGVPVPDGDLWP